MRTLTEIRQQYPENVFEGRLIPCSHGVDYFVTLERSYWERLDFLLPLKSESLEEIADFCFDLAECSVSEEGWEFDAAFRELLMYYIYRDYQGYVAALKGLSNDNRDNCFVH